MSALLPPSHGLLLFAHGARDPGWSAPFEAVARAVQARHASLPLRLAYLEFMAPGLLEAGAQLAALGCTQVAIAPLFLGAGGHVRKDVPHLVAQLRAAHPGIGWTLLPAIGETDSVVQAMAEAVVRGALGDTPSPDKPQP